VAGIAIHRGMRSSQGEAVVVLLDLLDRDLPAADRVTLLAIRSELSFVDVGVAVLATLSDVGEDRLDVALHTSDGLVHAAQRISRCVVIKLRDRANRLPSVWGVAVLTGNVQIAVRTVRSSGLRVRACRACGKCQQQQRE